MNKGFKTIIILIIGAVLMSSMVYSESNTVLVRLKGSDFIHFRVDKETMLDSTLGARVKDSKHQISNSKQAPNSKSQTAAARLTVLSFGHWSFGFVCDLEPGIWDF